MEPDEPLAGGTIDLRATLGVLKSRWRVIALCLALALTAAVIYLNLATYRYAIEMRVAPVSGGTGDASSKLSQLGGLAAVAGVSLPESGGSGSFKLFVEALHSRDVADVLARDPVIMHGVFAHEWDAKTRSWRVPTGFVHSVGGVIKPLLGVPQQSFAPPGAARLQQWMTEQIGVDQNLKTPVVTVSLMSEDPVFAIYFFNRLNVVVDTMLRQRALLRADDYIRYLSARLPTITLAEQRVAIAQALGEQERLKMAASSDRAYAADVFEHPAASDRPVAPVPAKVLLLAMLAGLAAGVVLALMLRQRPRRMLAGEL